eukprot:NODE_4965_length_1826_cov_2.079459.p2 GENE.NODE_4965_length_1826_cov_2.079459~~NODE_4965_length_1826_cov_2.079459.p2  ORF type:complete len:261 (+),score=83.30 NODE_4965_length_1826_cov_2.079459:951-1733(+)
MARMRVHELTLRAKADPEATLELGRACDYLGQLLTRLENDEGAQDSHATALHHIEAAGALSPPAWHESALWRGTLAHARGAALGGLRRFDAAKAEASAALAAVQDALSQEDPGEAPEALALDAVRLIHSLHEQTEDKAGVAGFLHHFHALLDRLHAKHGDAAGNTFTSTHGCGFGGSGGCARQPLLAPSPEALPSDREETVFAKILEEVLVLAMVVGSEDADALGRSIFVTFAGEVQRSARLQRQLGMLQAAGMFLDLGT